MDTEQMLEDATGILDRSIDTLDRRGWTQGVMEEYGRVCLMGALRINIYGSTQRKHMNKMEEFLLNIIADDRVVDKRCEPIDSIYMRVANFNDHAKTNKGSVIALLRRVKKQLA